jgi:hypothetical protein
MQITINEQALVADFSNLRNLEEVLVQLNDHHIPPGHLLFQVRVNGEFFSERYPRESRYVELQRVDSLDLKVVPDQEMARLNLAEAGFFAETLGMCLERSAVLFRLEDEEEANRYFAQVMDALRWLLKTGEEACQVLGIKLDKLSPQEDRPAGELLKRLQELLDEMLAVYQAQDYIILADLLEYELKPLVSQWQKLLVDLASP